MCYIYFPTGSFFVNDTKLLLHRLLLVETQQYVVWNLLSLKKSDVGALKNGHILQLLFNKINVVSKILRKC